MTIKQESKWWLPPTKKELAERCRIDEASRAKDRRAFNALSRDCRAKRVARIAKGLLPYVSIVNGVDLTTSTHIDFIGMTESQRRVFYIPVGTSVTSWWEQAKASKDLACNITGLLWFASVSCGFSHRSLSGCGWRYGSGALQLVLYATVIDRRLSDFLSERSIRLIRALESGNFDGFKDCPKLLKTFRSRIAHRDRVGRCEYVLRKIIRTGTFEL